MRDLEAKMYQNHATVRAKLNSISELLRSASKPSQSSASSPEFVIIEEKKIPYELIKKFLNLVTGYRPRSQILCSWSTHRPCIPSA